MNDKAKEASLELLRSTWGKGAAIHKQPPDLGRYEVLIRRVRPKVIVETGLMFGGSQIWFGERVPHVINVEKNYKTTRDYLENKHGLGNPATNGHMVMGDSLKVYPQVAALAKSLAGPVLVVLDSDHSTETVYGEMLLYGQLVTPGSYMVVEDGILGFMPRGKFRMGNWYDGSPLEAIAKFLPDHPEFEVDSEIEALFDGVTTNPMGWLRRRSFP